MVMCHGLQSYYVQLILHARALCCYHACVKTVVNFLCLNKIYRYRYRLVDNLFINVDHIEVAPCHVDNADDKSTLAFIILILYNCHNNENSRC